jgi:hypothetical protein
MSISRRGFFRQFLPGDQGEKDKGHRLAAIENYLYSNLLPYDFTLTDMQLDQLNGDIHAAAEALGDEDMNSPTVQQAMNRLTETRIQPWRADHWRAEELRQVGMTYVSEYLTREATPEDLQQLRNRFNVQYPTSTEEEVERQASAWLNNLSDARLLEYDVTSIRELVFSEIRSWC